jgi:hypothetical protein
MSALTDEERAVLNAEPLGDEYYREAPDYFGEMDPRRSAPSATEVAQ